MKRFATVAIILVQVWLLSPVCCCWFKAAVKANGGDSCCCSQSEEGSQSSSKPAKDRNCRCSESKIQLPAPQTVSISDTSKQVRPIEQLIPALTQLASLSIPDPAGPLDFRESPPPLAGADLLYELHRLNL